MSKRLVIDTDVATAAGGPDATDASAKLCRDTLKCILEVCHQAVFSDKALEEWRENESMYAKTWRYQMRSHDKLIVCNTKYPGLREDLSNNCDNDDIRRIIEKDIHVVEAAIASDKTVLSCDETVRYHLCDQSDVLRGIEEIYWVNPRIDSEDCPEWLEDGAPDEEHRRLINANEDG